MFLHETHMPQLLAPDAYTSQEQLDRELSRLLLPGWHAIGTLSELPREGDYLTIELFGRPLIVWRTAAGVQTFLNVCPHRFSRLKGDACGHAGTRLQCQYHGWEFDEMGITRKIPDARSFKPMEKGALGLSLFPTELCGQVIFVKLCDEGPGLAEYLGPGYDVGRELCSSDKKLALSLDYEVDANWKVKSENSLESYHVDMVHTATFGRTPDAEKCTHELNSGWTTFATDQAADSAFERLLDRVVFRLARVEPDYEYKHYHYYPHVMFGKMRLFSWIEMVYPLSPHRSRVLGKFFCDTGRGGPLRSRLLGRALASWETKFFKTLADEDSAIMREVQRGLRAPRQPSSGVISIREERCFHFQQYIKESTAAKTPQRRAASVSA